MMSHPVSPFAQTPQPARRTRRRAFTLIEVLIVVVILGILASTVLPSFEKKSTSTREKTFINSIRVFITAAQIHQARTGVYPGQAAAGVIPAGFEPFVPVSAWNSETVIGGQWDVDTTDAGVECAIGVHFGGVSPPLDLLTKIDEIHDDGDLATGRFRQFGSNRFYHVVAE